MSNAKARKSVNILKVQIDGTSKSRVLRFVQSSLKNQNKFFITTPNPEIVLKAQNDERLLQIINDSDIRLPDGIGLSMAAKFLSIDAPDNIALRSAASFMQGLGVGVALFVDRQWLTQEIVPIKGRDLFLELIRLANKKKWKVFLLGGEQEGVGNEAKLRLERTYKGIRIDRASGPLLNQEGKPLNAEEQEKEMEAVDRINDFEPQILFVAFGAPKQEKWVGRWMDELKVGGVMVVGGTIDYFAGNTDLPPHFIDELGLEWLWRLFKQPWRLKRVLRATVVFPWKVFLHKLSKEI